MPILLEMPAPELSTIPSPGLPLTAIAERDLPSQKCCLNWCDGKAGKVGRSLLRNLLDPGG